MSNLMSRPGFTICCTMSIESLHPGKTIVTGFRKVTEYAQFINRFLLSFFIITMLISLITDDHSAYLAQTTTKQSSITAEQAVRPVDIDSLLITDSPEERALITAFMEKTQRMAVSISEKGYHINFNGRLDFFDPDTFETEKNRYKWKKPSPFGNDPEVVTRLTADAILAYRKAGVEVAIKHFLGTMWPPGDSHYQVLKFDGDITPHLQAYKKAIQSGASWVMLGHIIVPEISGDRPMSVSPEGIRYLRKNLKFNGMIIADDFFNMNGILNYYREARGKKGKPDQITAAVKDFILSGGDLFISVNPKILAEDVLPEIIRTLNDEPEGELAHKVNEASVRIFRKKASLFGVEWIDRLLNDKDDRLSVNERIKKLVNHLSMNVKLAQMIMLHFPDDSPLDRKYHDTFYAFMGGLILDNADHLEFFKSREFFIPPFYGVHRYLLGTKEEMEKFGSAYEKLLKNSRREREHERIKAASSRLGKAVRLKP